MSNRPLFHQRQASLPILVSVNSNLVAIKRLNLCWYHANFTSIILHLSIGRCAQT